MVEIVSPVMLASVIAVCLVSVGAAAGPVAKEVASYLAGKELQARRSCETVDDALVVRHRWLLSPVALGSVAGVTCGLTAAWGGGRGVGSLTIIAVPTVALLSAACCVDAACHRLPNRLLAATACWVLAAEAAAAVIGLAAAGTPATTAWPVLRAVLCAGGAGGLVLLAALVPSGLGMGDVKLSAVLGLWLGHLGVAAVVAGIVLGFVLAGVVAIVLMIAGVVDRKQHIALGPYLAAGAWLSWILGAVP